MDLITKNLSILIKTSSKTRTQIAKEIGVSNSVVSDYIAGRSIPSVPTLIKICQALDCSYEDILGRLD